VVGEVGEPSTNKTYTEIFNEAFPYYLSIGMTYELYWHGEPWLVKAYQEAYERQIDRMNYEKWLQGRYVYQAIGALVPILNPLSKKKKAEEYLKEPLIITEKAKKRKEIEEGKKTANFLIAWAGAIKKKAEKEKGI
jgi:hypothetical protein